MPLLLAKAMCDAEANIESWNCFQKPIWGGAEIRFATKAFSRCADCVGVKIANYSRKHFQSCLDVD